MEGNNQNLKEADRCTGWCVNNRQPWAAPGRTPSLGGGCGVYGGNPNGCPAHNDTRAAGSDCPGGMRSFGSEARFVEFPKMITTEWELGSVQEIAWSAGTGRHMGGYTFRLELISQHHLKYHTFALGFVSLAHKAVLGSPKSASLAMCSSLPPTSP